MSSTYNIYYEGLENEEAPFFMVKVLNEKNITKYEGIYSDPEIFNVTEEEVSDFDKNFPPKKTSTFWTTKLVIQKHENFRSCFNFFIFF